MRAGVAEAARCDNQTDPKRVPDDRRLLDDVFSTRCRVGYGAEEVDSRGRSGPATEHQWHSEDDGLTMKVHLSDSGEGERESVFQKGTSHVPAPVMPESSSQQVVCHSVPGQKKSPSHFGSICASLAWHGMT